MNMQVVSQLFGQIIKITKNLFESKEKELRSFEKEINDFYNKLDEVNEKHDLLFFEIRKKSKKKMMAKEDLEVNMKKFCKEIEGRILYKSPVDIFNKLNEMEKIKRLEAKILLEEFIENINYLKKPIINSKKFTFSLEKYIRRQHINTIFNSKNKLDLLKLERYLIFIYLTKIFQKEEENNILEKIEKNEILIAINEKLKTLRYELKK